MARTTDSGVVLLENLNLRNASQKSMLELEDALAAPPSLVLQMDGACTLTLVVADARRKLIRSPLIQEKSWSEVLGIRFELVATRKSGDRVTLTYEDGITAALRRRNSRMLIRAGTMTRAGILEKLADEANVPASIDPADGRGKVRNAVRRSAKGDRKTNSWDLTGQLAEEVRWRRFSNGRRLVAGSDGWLMDTGDPIRLTENTGAVRNIDFDLDTGKRASAATVTVDATIGALPPGQLVILDDDMGPAEGRWLVRSFQRDLSSTTATVPLVRARHELKEPKRSGAGDPGEPDYIPGVGTGADGGGLAANAARERLVSFALAQRGDAYQWGGNGPSEWDCSGLVQAATAAAGHTLTKPSSSQASAVAAAGKGLTIEAAIRTRGALLFRMGSPYNHVAISLGNGQTIEAMGEAYGVCIGSANGRGWTSAGWWV
ncbi:C40 family peptidase [Nocardioides sp. SR21]|uniref:C40 family peptidase n=1 Tax=Nocardioides sp. SR21 TaxID=2919501 RepID=UPI001FAA1AC2|nr:NlpC/P60 family protein [Nocardioides sp. SR21]